MSSTIAKIKRDIQTAILTGKVTKTELARQADIPITTLIGCEKPGWNPHSTTLAALESALAKLERKPRPKVRRGAYQPAA